MKRLALMVEALALVVSEVEQASAGIAYDAAADFSLTSNPNGVWSYGYSTTLRNRPGITSRFQTGLGRAR